MRCATSAERSVSLTPAASVPSNFGPRQTWRDSGAAKKGPLGGGPPQTHLQDVHRRFRDGRCARRATCLGRAQQRFLSSTLTGPRGHAHRRSESARFGVSLSAMTRP
jgi:hypothetical protein